MIRNIVRRHINSVVLFMTQNNKHAMIGFLFSLITSGLAQEKVQVIFDGQDWVHKWKDGVFVHGTPVFFPSKHVDSNLHIFTRYYRPKQGDNVIDVGAGSGTEINFFSQAVGKEGRVYAVEADPVAFRRLVKLISLLECENVVPINKAIGAKLGFGKIVSDTQGDISGRLKKYDNSSKNESLIEITTLDSITNQYCISKIDFLKVNVEGHELEVLEGLNLSKKLVRNFCVSCHDFLGNQVQPTFVRVKGWLQTNKFNILENPEAHRRNYVGFYIYARNHENPVGSSKQYSGQSGEDRLTLCVK